MNTADSGKISWRSPSNIALVKYWGKKEVQLPANPSISFTLNASCTESTLHYTILKKDESPSFEVWFEGERNLAFEPKVQSFLSRVEGEFPFLKNYQFKLETSNTFPHSSGIASSASGMSALALCLCSLELVLNQEQKNESFFRKASEIARLGSGSAARSVYGGLAVWGKHRDFPESSDEYAIPFQDEIDDVFSNFKDVILLVEKGQKEVSSSLGHSLMKSNPFSDKRFEVAHFQMSELKKILKSGDVRAFGKIVEQEALMLHALMMTSDPYFILLKPNTLQIIEKVWQKRNQNDYQMYITLDAGANVHLLFPAFEEKRVMEFVENELIGYCKNSQYICDEVGNGPIELDR